MEENNLQNEGTEKMYSQEEVNQLLQKEGDKRVSEALKKQEKRLSEQQRLSMMSEQEKFQYQLDEREKVIAEKEKALALAEMKNEASKILAEKGLDNAFVDFVVSGNAEETNSRINALDKVFKACVKSEIEKRIGGQTPPRGAASNNVGKDFTNMTLAERQALAHNQPEIYKSNLRR